MMDILHLCARDLVCCRSLEACTRFAFARCFATHSTSDITIVHAPRQMLKNLLDACGASLAFFTIGYAFAFGDDNPGGSKTFLGTRHFFLLDEDDYSFFLFQYAFSAASATIVAGTLVRVCGVFFRRGKRNCKQ